jgi:hypothetical protein
MITSKPFSQTMESMFVVIIASKVVKDCCPSIVLLSRQSTTQLSTTKQATCRSVPLLQSLMTYRRQ